MANVDTVQHMYDSFRRGDISAFLDHLAPAVEWEYGVNSTDVPWLQPRRGPAEVRQFFESVAALEIA